jgi:predicted DNA-binding transcriptional regulator AlpA
MKHLENQKPDSQRSLTSDIATPPEVAKALRTTEASLAQMRYKGTGPNFVKVGRRVLYRWSDVEKWIASSVYTRTDQSRSTVPG